MFGGDFAYYGGSETAFWGRHARIARGSAMFGGNFAYYHGKIAGKKLAALRGLREGVPCLGATLRIVVVKRRTFGAAMRGLREAVQCLGKTLHIAVVI